MRAQARCGRACEAPRIAGFAAAREARHAVLAVPAETAQRILAEQPLTVPITRIGWDQLSSLLENEGQLTESSKAEIARGLQQIDIQEKAREIEERIKKGESIPDPTWPESSPRLSLDLLKQGQFFNIIRWTAIKELGLDEVGDYASTQRAAALEAYRIVKERGDLDNF